MTNFSITVIYIEAFFYSLFPKLHNTGFITADIRRVYNTLTELYSEPCQISEMNCSVKIVNNLRHLQFSGKVPSQMYERVPQKQPMETFYKVFLEILQNSQENTCARDSFFL